MGRGPPSHWKLSGALSPLLHFGPAFLLSDSFITSGPNSAPTLSPAPPLSAGLAFVHPLSARFICSSKRFPSSRTPLPHKPLHLVIALLQSPYKCKCSAIILSLSVFSLLPEPLASLAPFWSLWAPRHYLYVDCLFCGDHHCTARGPSHCWTELSWAGWAAWSCTVLPCLITHLCSVDEQGEYSTVWHAVWQGRPSN